jgi:hypothetical protein
VIEMRRTMSVAALSMAAGYSALQLLGRRAGSTAAERRASRPGDELVKRPQMVMNHAATIDAPADRIWPWLTQLGWHLGGWYTPHWVDRLLFPENWASLDRLDPHLVRDLRVGDMIPDGAPGTAEYVVDRVEPPHVLVLRSTTHMPPGWEAKYGTRFFWTWCFQLSDLPGGRTRVHLRVRGRGGPWWFIALYNGALVPADYVMSTGMLRGLRRRAEGSQVPQVSGRAPLAVQRATAQETVR